MLHTRVVHSLEKIFTDTAPREMSRPRLTALRGERVCFQVAVDPDGHRVLTLPVKADSALPVELYTVGWVPATLPAYPFSDDWFLRKEAGLFPDPLFPTDSVRLVSGQWRAVWAEVTIPEAISAGTYPVAVSIGEGDESATVTVSVEVLSAVLPPQKLLYTGWFHNDCLAVHYDVPVFSEAHWALIDRYLENAAKYGLSLLLTPLLTPPLDTAVGHERPTVQLIGVSVENGAYRFDLTRLERYLSIAERHGITHFEMAHLFTQWGAKCAPKVVANIDGEERRLFGWDTAATSPDYVRFLREMLTAVRRFLEARGTWERCYFHISDEPSPEAMESYAAARNSVADILKGAHFIDALSDYAFYRSGLVPTPIPALNEITPFLEGGVPELWTYYCCGQTVANVSNKMLAMPGQRTRVLGMQLFKYRAAGFLQWGHNFWFDEGSRHPVDPYAVTDGKAVWPAGDPFVVYPGEDGRPVPSIRQMLFFDALQDLRALQLLEERTSHDAAVALIEEGLEKPLTFFECPHDAAWLIAARERINDALR